jgi:hypothetical protein
MDQPFRSDLVSIERIETSDPGDDSRSAHDQAGTDFLQSKQVVVASGLFYSVIKRAKRLVDALFESGVLRRQSGHSVLDYISQVSETGEIVFANRTKDKVGRHAGQSGPGIEGEARKIVEGQKKSFFIRLWKSEFHHLNDCG